MSTLKQLGDQFAQILNGEAKMTKNGCSVSLKRSFHVHVQGRPSHSVGPVGISFESLDVNGNALNLGEITLLEQEIPNFMRSVVGQGLIVSALHNHWIFTQPNLMYIHIQSVEPPLSFARKVATAFTTLTSAPVKDKSE
jgi:Domain of Unknown Function (DUF1259)